MVLGIRRPHLVMIASIWIILTVAAVVTGKLGWYVAVATFGTALGTILLALYTYRLALSTQESVRESRDLGTLARDQLSEVQKQRGLFSQQLDSMITQAIATKELAVAASRSAVEAARARIDAIAPLLRLTVNVAEVWTREPGSDVRGRLDPMQRWFVPELRGKIFDVVIDFELHNVGFSSALVTLTSGSFGGYGIDFEGGPQNIVLETGEKYKTHMIVTVLGADAVESKRLSVAVTYHGLLHGEMFDHLQWDGWVTVLSLADERATPVEADEMLNAGFAQVVRSYLNLERPEEMAEGRARLLKGDR